MPLLATCLGTGYQTDSRSFSPRDLSEGTSCTTLSAEYGRTSAIRSFRLDGMTSRKLAPTAASFTSALAACGPALSSALAGSLGLGQRLWERSGKWTARLEFAQLSSSNRCRIANVQRLAPEQGEELVQQNI